jgi:two-component system, cell cycle sensor histidine kinase and response regulator CckA
LNSEEIGRGTTQIEENATDIAFVSAADAIIQSIFSEQGEVGGSETILLVEDEEFVRKATSEVLESAGYRLFCVRCATEALAALRACSEPIDLLLTDVVLPGKSGHELACEFAGLFPDARILLMSGYAEQLAFGVLSVQGREYLAKPFSTRTLLRRVREALDRVPVNSTAPV